MEGFELLQKWLVLTHSSSWHTDCQCWAGRSKGGSPLYMLQLMLHEVNVLHWSQSHRNLGSDHRLARKQRFYNMARGGCDTCWRGHYKINYQEMRNNMPCSLMCPFVLWENIRAGRLLHRVLYNKLQKLLKEENWANLQKWRPSIWF